MSRSSSPASPSWQPRPHPLSARHGRNEHRRLPRRTLAARLPRRRPDTHPQLRGKREALARRLLLPHGRRCTSSRCERDCPIELLGERHRFFYAAKAPRREREAGCEQLPRRVVQTFKIGAKNEQLCKANPVANIHPTVKPIDLMRWLVRSSHRPAGSFSTRSPAAAAPAPPPCWRGRLPRDRARARLRPDREGADQGIGLVDLRSSWIEVDMDASNLARKQPAARGDPRRPDCCRAARARRRAQPNVALERRRAHGRLQGDPAGRPGCGQAPRTTARRLIVRLLQRAAAEASADALPGDVGPRE